MQFTGYLDIWFTDRPLVERVAPFSALDIFCLDEKSMLEELRQTCKKLFTRSGVVDGFITQGR